MGLTTTKLRAAWKQYECRETDMVTISFGPDLIRVAPPTQGAWKALATVLNHHDYNIRLADTDSYNCRTITGGSGKSLHSYGIALDINWKTNPFIETPDKRPVRFSDKATQAERATDVKQHLADTDMTPEMIADAVAIVTTEGKKVFEWGGHWRNVKDAMHFELDLAPEDLAAGVDWSSVKGHADPIGEPQAGAGAAMAAPPAGAPTPAFETSHPFIAKWEGGFVNDPDDPGGATNMGITIDTLRRWRGTPVSVDDVRNLTEDEARRIFFANYWRKLRCDEMPLALALMTYNAGVNSGPGRGAKFLQRTLVAQGQQIAIDGQVGPNTLAASRAVDERRAVESYSDIYENYYRGLSKFWKYGKGWLNRLFDIESGALGLVGATPAPTPHIQPATGGTIMSDTTDPAAGGKTTNISDLVSILTQAAELAQTIQKLKAEGGIAAQPAQPQVPQAGATTDFGAILQALAGVAAQLGATSQPVAPPPPPPPPPEVEPLTPVNGALGEGIGKALNGRKTALGIIGLLATSVIPIIFPAAAPIAAGITALIPANPENITTLDTTVQAAQPLFGALAGWGVLGKIDKWIAKLRS